MGTILRTAAVLVAGSMGLLFARSASADLGSPSGGTDWTVLWRQAKDAASAGRLSEAEELLARARRTNPSEVDLLRSSCEVGVALEQRGQAKESSRNFCHGAYTRGDSPEDGRNEVASMLAPRQHPSLDDLVLAVLIADATVKKANDQPWGYLARCDIARRLGNADVMEACLADLKRIAPRLNEFTKAALATANGPTAPRWPILLPLLVVMAVVGTVVHGALRRYRGRQRPRSEVAVAALVVVMCALSGAARAQAPSSPAPIPPGAAAPAGQVEALPGENKHLGNLKKDHLSKFPINDADPEAGVPSAEELGNGPLQYGYYIQDLADRAERAIKAGNHAAAARYFAALSKISPTSSYGPRKVCEELEAAGDIPSAVMACRTAITREGSTVNDYVRFVHLALSQKQELGLPERKELDAVVAHVAGQPGLGLIPAMLRCEVGMKFEDTKALQACTAELQKLAPADPRTISYQWALAVKQKDKAVALQLIKRARDAGMNGDGVARMERATHQMAVRQIGRLVIAVLCAAMLAVFLVVAFRRSLSRRRVSV